MIYKVLNKKINKKIIQKCCKIGDNYLIDRNKIDQLNQNEKNSLNLLKVSDRYVDYASLEKPSKVVIKGVEISNFSKPIIIAGPCSIESQHQFEKTYRYMKNIGCIDIVRGGLFKPRTSNYDFQGLGKSGLEIMKNIIKDENIPIVSEVMSIEELIDMKDSLDIIQIGARNMQNYPLLKACGRVSNPIILKRGLSATLDELLNAAEYIVSSGNPNVILCERGIRTFETAYRNVSDINAIPKLQKLTHLPVIFDPSHSTGQIDLIKPLALAGIAAGAAGIMIETHYNPEVALSDGPQSLNQTNYSEVVNKICKMINAMEQINEKY